jgi:hypothetical protein
MTYQPNDRVRLTVPGNYADHEGAGRRLGVHLVFRVLHDLRVLDDTDGRVRVTHDVTGRRYVLPAKQLTRVGPA